MLSEVDIAMMIPFYSLFKFLFASFPQDQIESAWVELIRDESTQSTEPAEAEPNLQMVARDRSLLRSVASHVVHQAKRRRTALLPNGMGQKTFSGTIVD